MSTAAGVISAPRSQPISGIRTRLRRIPFENLILFTIALAFYVAVAAYLVLHLNFMIGDALARVDNAFNVLFTRDPHLAAIGFYWPPLPSFLELPIIAFKPFFPALVTKGFAGSIEAALFGAGTVVLFNSALRWAGVVRGMRWVICILWMINPMIIIYSILGMGEGPFMFFLAAAVIVFLRWCESRRASLLPLCGILIGLSCLCRYEAFLVAVVLGVGIVMESARGRSGWRKVETEAIMYALPALLVVMLWIGSAAIIMHDILYPIHAAGASTGANGVSRAAAYGVVQLSSAPSAINFVIGHSVALFPGVVAAVGLVAVTILLRQRRRIPGLILLASGLIIPLFDIYMIKQGGLAKDLRYQISVIPFAFLCAVYALRSLKSHYKVLASWAALGIAFLFGLSNVITAQTVADPSIGIYEAPAVAAVTTSKPVNQLSDVDSILAGAPVLARQIEALDSDRGLILCDSANCFPIVLNTADSAKFVVTSDRIFEAAAAQPLVYDVEYFLVPEPGGTAAFNRLNILYPSLYENGGGFATLVGQVGNQQTGVWRLYRITGPTGRG